MKNISIYHSFGVIYPNFNYMFDSKHFFSSDATASQLPY